MPPKKFTIEQENKIVEYYFHQRFSLRRITKEFNCHHSTIQAILERHNFKTRSQSESQKGKVGSKSKNWKGGRIIDQTNGYVLMWCQNHPFRIRNQVYEHRLIMEKHLDRFLNPREVVHHINGDKTDNRINNLKLFNNNKDHLRWHRLQYQQTELLKKTFICRVEGISERPGRMGEPVIGSP